MPIALHKIAVYCLLAGLPTLAYGMPDVLPAEEAYQHNIEIDADAIRISWQMPKEYYLYKKSLRLETDNLGVTLQAPEFGPAEIKNDEYFGRTEIYRDTFSYTLAYNNHGLLNEAQAILHWQGCTDFGFCYPPKRTPVTLTFPQDTGSNALLQALANNPGLSEGQTFLPADQAFQVNAIAIDPFRIEVQWQIAEGYYVYQDKIRFESPEQPFQTGQAELSDGQPKFDEHFGDTRVYYQQARASLPIQRAQPEAFEAELTVHYQGCAEDGICYPPAKKVLPITFPSASSQDQMNASLFTQNETTAPVNEATELTQVITQGALFWIVLVFLGLGVLLTFTPCVLPMMPILSGVIIGQKNNSTARAFKLSVVYVLAMSLTYTLAGVLVALLGENLQATFQNPWILYAFTLLFVLFGLSMFDVIEIKMPAFVQNWAQRASQSQRSGSYVGVSIMGVLSALIVGPCIAAPLAAALIVIGQTGDPLRGGLALFSLSIGMGIPLIIFGTSVGKLLPKAGTWMQHVKALFGFMMFGLCIWMLSRLWPAAWIMSAYALLFLSMAYYCFKKLPNKLNMMLGALCFAYAAALAYGAIIGAHNPLHPLTQTQASVEFKSIKTLKDLEQALDKARHKNQSVLLDFYADWCVACKEMEHLTFTDSGVQQVMNQFMLLQADVTANDADDQALMQQFNVFGPPMILVFDELGRELPQQRVIGFLAAEPLQQHLQAL